ncbi:MAG TPA: hypothetical protein VF831_05205, partial [Anaerolineales bacterium]
ITAAIGKLAGINLETLPLRIFNSMAAKISTFSGLSYKTLAHVTEQWPIVGRGDMYYGGTLYANDQGLGEQLSYPVQTPALAWPQIPEASQPAAGLLAVPINLLYDRGQTIYRSMLLHQRIPPANITLHPVDAQKLNLTEGIQVKFNLGGNPIEAQLHLSEDIPLGVALIPRSLGVPISAPTVVELQAA